MKKDSTHRFKVIEEFIHEVSYEIILLCLLCLANICSGSRTKDLYEGGHFGELIIECTILDKRIFNQSNRRVHGKWVKVKGILRIAQPANYKEVSKTKGPNLRLNLEDENILVNR